jgi:hypothetical protein
MWLLVRPTVYFRYDPRFFLSLAAQLCAPGSFVDRHLHLVESGLLPLALAATSSRAKTVRRAAYLVLARMYQVMDSAKLAGEKRVWLHLLDSVRNAVAAATTTSTDKDSFRLPPLVASSFIVKACKALKDPSENAVHRAITSYLLAKPALDLFQVSSSSTCFSCLVKQCSI